MSADNLDTKPTIETVLERINALAEVFQQEISKLHTRLDEELGKVHGRLDEYDTRFDRLEKVILQTRLEFVEFRGDLKEWRKQLRDVLPPVA
jgi:chromosome segregation ATPase